ncbi:uncharacterized protein AB675_9997 [Cyphellophora attinorum]|uniref:EDC4-like protein pdc1 beta-propeller domain-containing protein n=1 Tax=Cyphellophora attinorum TaxID=1664694 RepID=A0A0N0NJH1_9EURO|nr:uncharacterized protein AB675_9997 [Phialophora attinorum]KPI36629.1 hypothetical protein AB675_9997 [Phialophora attinorum]
MAGSSNVGGAQSLLNLLNYGNPKSSTATSNAPPPASQTPTPAPAAQVDLLAMLRKGATPVPRDGDAAAAAPAKAQEASDEEMLKKLIGQRQPSRSTREASNGSPATPTKHNGDAVAEPPRSNGTQAGPKTEPLFTYTNPFKALQESRKATPTQATPQATPQGKASPSPVFTSPAVDAPAWPQEFPHRRMLTPRSASAKADRLARQNSVKSSGTPEPVVKEEAAEASNADLPIRSKAVEEAEKSQPAEVPASIQEKATLASEEVGWENPSKDSPPGAADEWEDAEESPSPQAERGSVPVYNFPIRPFIALTLNLASPSEVTVRDEGVMEISRLKKEFDQLDRSLAAATTKYIAYALVKNGGIRIIQQDNGSDRQVFKNSGDRVFNVSFCTTAHNAPASDHQAILGTGVSGTVYYATVSKEGNDLFAKNELDTEILSFPPWPPADEGSAGGVLKTRAKKSSRHPEYFAIGRGKSIHIIWPATAMFPKYGIGEKAREVDMELLYKERNLQIATGKAGKDFSFSEDDTLIVSLDKTGRLRFWDIRPLTDDANATSGRIEPVKVDTPLLSLMTASPSEKSWPTSVLLIDKARPYLKGGAQRYVLVGLRQNHTLQLWDIALGKAVQELNFPHESETDGVCSVNYHPQSGYIVVGHPTRNSIFFIHLSAPRYAGSSSTDQATYVSMIASKDPDAPKPESTACMSAVREISFASLGQLRSVELLSLYKATKTEKSADDPLFELYVVHAKGVTCLTITKEDLGLDAASKVVEGIDAVKAGIVSTKDLKLGSIIEESSSRARSPPEELTPAPSKSSKKKAKKAQQDTSTSVEQGEVVEVPIEEALPAESATNGVSKAEPANEEPLIAPKESKKSKKKAVQEAKVKPPSRTGSPAKTATSSAAPQLEPNVTSEPPELPPTTSAPAAPAAPTEDMAASAILQKAAHEMSITQAFRSELANLYKDIQNDRIAQDATASARQEAILRLVSQTLTNNVDKSLANIVSTQIQQGVIPGLQATVGEAVSRSLQQVLPQEVAKQLPSALQATLTGPKFAQSIQENISQKLSKSLEAQVVDTINRNVGGAVAAAAEKAASAVETRMVPLFQKLENDRRNDRERLEKFNTAIAGMVETLKSMSETQVAFQNQILLDRQQLSAAPPGVAQMSASPAPIAQPRAIKPKSAQELERDEVEALMNAGQYEDASIKWLHSAYQVELFDNLFVGFTPEYLATDASALVAFSIAVTVSKSLDTNVEARLDWIKAAVDAVDWRDPEITELSSQAPQLLDTLISKIEGST